jgi:putative nucleotidyltransferase with HDIG domain
MFKFTRSKPTAARTARRREEIRRIFPRPTFSALAVLQKPEFIHTALILMAFIIAASAAVVWSRDQVKVRDGQIMTVTKLKRLPYRVEDAEATTALREEARKSAPRVYRLNTMYLTRLEASLAGLPKAVVGKTDPSEISEELQKEFELTGQDLQALQAFANTERAQQVWTDAIRRLIHDRIRHVPLLKSQEYQIYTTTAKKVVMLPEGALESLLDRPIELRADTSPPDPRLRDLIAATGFPANIVPVVWKRLTADPQPTILHSDEDTKRFAEEAAQAVRPVWIDHQRGDVLYRRGDRLTPEQLAEVQTEMDEYRANAPPLEHWRQRLGAIGLVAIVSLFLGSFAHIAYPKIVRNPLRIAALCGLMGMLLATSVSITAFAPAFLLPAALGPTLIVAIILLVAYDQRLALLLSGIQCMLVTMALEQSVPFFILLIAGCGTMIAQLRELRHRNSLIRAATATAAVTGVGTMLLGFYEVPWVPGAHEQILIHGFSAVGTSYGVAFLVLGILPSIERLFDITTGMTLAELRDPKRPLLRQLQQRAPGTYNHSLQVANIAEAAAESIGADSLLVYVGALYHDIGKINKPDYFVENQSSGQNKHDKLSPAMSLLVIIGHVKNGIELAREYGLPRQIIHFIESHHGTTLVEYFYHAAKAKSEFTDAGPSVAEVEYRYPGPKPHTKEAAILMLSDAIESATRAMPEPNPSRIENLVRKLSQKRLEDGQFDQCDLTFKELSMIEDAIINRLLAIYHGRISYPSGTIRPSETQPEAPRTTASTTPKTVSA